MCERLWYFNLKEYYLTYIGQIIRDDIENEVQMFILICVAHDPDLTLGRPGEQLGQVVNDDGDEGQVEIGDSTSQACLEKSGIKIVRRQQVSDHVHGFVVDFVFSGQKKENGYCYETIMFGRVTHAGRHRKAGALSVYLTHIL